MSATSLDDLWAARLAPADNPEAARMLHVIPDALVVEREAFILERCAGKRVLNIGSAGTDGAGDLHKRICEVAKEAWSVDREGADCNVDLDNPDDYDAISLTHPVLELVVCGEVLEHLTRPGYLLQQLRALAVPVILTVPNAFSEVGYKWIAQGRECVNVDHVAWYSWRTLTTLVERCGFRTLEWYWYNGQPRYAEGLVFVVEPCQ